MSFHRILLTALTASFAFAHVVVLPESSAIGQEQEYTMHVPNEKKVNNTGVKLTFPAGVEVLSVAEKPGWKLEVEKNPAGKIVAASWTGSLPSEEVGEFKFKVRNPAQPGTLAWKAAQTFQDGSVTQWTGAKGTKTPAPLTVVK